MSSELTKSEPKFYDHTFAVLNKSGEPNQCGKQRWFKWFHLRGGEQRGKIRKDLVGNILIETLFTGESSVLDGPPQFWLCRLTSSPGREHLCETLVDALRCASPFRFERSFATREEALKFHESVRKRVRAKDRNSRKMPDKTRDLLLKLQDWCGQKHGRQTQVARAVGTKPQVVNDWLNGRRKIPAEAALRILALLNPGQSIYLRKGKVVLPFYESNKSDLRASPGKPSRKKCDFHHPGQDDKCPPPPRPPEGSIKRRKRKPTERFDLAIPRLA